MGLFDGGRRRAEQLEAQRVLSDLQHRKLRLPLVSDWTSAHGMLTHGFTAEKARKSAIDCSLRIKYLEVPEPRPVMESFAPSYLPSLERCPATLAEVQSRYQLELQRHVEREKARLHELEQ